MGRMIELKDIFIDWISKVDGILKYTLSAYILSEVIYLFFLDKINKELAENVGIENYLAIVQYKGGIAVKFFVVAILFLAFAIALFVLNFKIFTSNYRGYSKAD